MAVYAVASKQIIPLTVIIMTCYLTVYWKVRLKIKSVY